MRSSSLADSAVSLAITAITRPPSAGALPLYHHTPGEQLVDLGVTVPDLAENLHRMLAELRGHPRRHLVDAVDPHGARHGERRAGARILERHQSAAVDHLAVG